MPRLSQAVINERLTLHREGYTDKQIAQAQGVNAEAINNWRRRRGLPLNRARNINKCNRFQLLYRRGPGYETTKHERQLVRECIGKLCRVADSSNRTITVNGISRYLEEWRQEYGGVTE
jgi:hypothetical protein